MSMEKKYSEALKNNDTDLLQEVISELNSLSPSAKKEKLDLYKKIGEELFAKNINIANYDFKAFKQKIDETGGHKRIGTKPLNENDFEDIFVQFYIGYFGWHRMFIRTYQYF